MLCYTKLDHINPHLSFSLVPVPATLHHSHIQLLRGRGCSSQNCQQIVGQRKPLMKHQFCFAIHFMRLEFKACISFDILFWLSSKLSQQEVSRLKNISACFLCSILWWSNHKVTETKTGMILCMIFLILDHNINIHLIGGSDILSA